MARGQITIIGKATSDGDSLRTTIPMGIVKQLDLKEGEKLSWKIEAKDGALIVVLEPIKTEANEHVSKGI